MKRGKKTGISRKRRASKDIAEPDKSRTGKRRKAEPKNRGRSRENSSSSRMVDLDKVRKGKKLKDAFKDRQKKGNEMKKQNQKKKGSKRSKKRGKSDSSERERTKVPEEFEETFRPLKDRKFNDKIARLLIKEYKLENRIEKIVLSNEYLETEGVDGYDQHEIYTFGGIEIKYKTGKIFTFVKGQIWKLPKKEEPNISQIFGFEVNIKSNGKLESAAFITKN